MNNIILLVILLVEGALIKHLPTLKNVSNKLIPSILIVSSFVISVICEGNVSVEVIRDALFDALIAVGTHQFGKETMEHWLAIFRIWYVKKNTTINPPADETKGEGNKEE